MHTAPAAGDLCIALAGLALLLLWDANGWGLPLARLFGGPAGFALREHWFTAGLLHQGGRWLSALLFGLTVVIAVHPIGPWRGLDRRQRLTGLCSTVFLLLLIPLLKQHSATSCPWSLREFGGVAQHVSHWRLGVPDNGPGHCFPSGHASGAFAFLSLAFALRGTHPRLARASLVAIGLLGAAFGLAQMARGAHFASHTLYTAELCWCVTALAWHRFAAGRRTAAPCGLAAAEAVNTTALR